MCSFFSGSVVPMPTLPVFETVKMSRISELLSEALHWVLTVGEGELVLGEGELTVGEGELVLGEGELTVGEGELVLGEGELKYEHPLIFPLESVLIKKTPTPKLPVSPATI